MKTITNKLRYQAVLLHLVQTVDDNDRPISVWKPLRPIQYGVLGVTAQDKFLSMQAKKEVVYKIVVRYDKTLSEKTNRVQINSVPYVISRIYISLPVRTMEVSLSYVS